MASVIQNEINRIVAERDTQTNLISQIATALEGKAAGGGGSGGSIETCNVTINANIGKARALTYNNGVFAVENNSGGESTYTFNNVVKGSMIIAEVNGSSITYTNATQYECLYMDEFAMNYIYIAIAG